MLRRHIILIIRRRPIRGSPESDIPNIPGDDFLNSSQEPHPVLALNNSNSLMRLTPTGLYLTGHRLRT